MNCLSLNSCQCTLGTEVKTELIIYQTGSISNRQSASFRERDFKVKRLSQQNNKIVQRQSERFNIIKSSAKADETIDTPNKMISMSSNQYLRKSKQPLKTVIEFSGKLKTDKNIEIEIQEQNKQNINQNCIESRIQSQLQSPKISIMSESKTRMSSICLNKLKSTRLSEGFNGSLPFQSPHSSNVTEKNIATILLQRQNSQLRSQLSKLKQEEQQLRQQQQKIKQKSNWEINHLKKRGQELERRSYQRKKQLQQLNQMLKIANKIKNSQDIVKRSNNQ